MTVMHDKNAVGLVEI